MTAVVIVGGGLAGAITVEKLRDRGFDGRITLFAAEPHLPYDRVPLSKDFLAAKTSAVAVGYAEAGRRLGLPAITVHDADWYSGQGVEVRVGTRVTVLDPAGHRVTLADGSGVGYDRLVLATGARARRLPIPGADAAGVHYLRTADDAAALDAVLRTGSSLVVIGAGWIGLEVAASARARGVDVTVLGRSALPLPSLGPEVGQIFADLHWGHGVDLRLSAAVVSIRTAGGVATGVELGDGSVVAADTVLIAVGAQPNVELACEAGLTVADGGVAVDAALRSSAPDVFAVGDVAAAEHPLLGARLAGGHWAEALKQPAVVAAGILGQQAQYADLPYFFTDQYELGMEYVGYAPDYARVVFQGDVDSGAYLVFWLAADDRVLAGMTVNVMGRIGEIKELIRSGGVLQS
ncbi:FAD-dependent oxidoreductase [Mycobacterium sp. M1]|uniref:FAD-dependent oxidoreductase n=1 Tax=Mycolicibacter acidiphilus TaxID=2835306 RepID=A0ABS5REY4_9MYCO|nr:FAD-dependent oxidoreductase [Mycolicibacter acidiphilus]MBS9532845.1 FAD-dependent oxidoreductase [Mycolicibacter acidiphilus]